MAAAAAALKQLQEVLKGPNRPVVYTPPEMVPQWQPQFAQKLKAAVAAALDAGVSSAKVYQLLDSAAAVDLDALPEEYLAMAIEAGLGADTAMLGDTETLLHYTLNTQCPIPLGNINDLLPTSSSSSSHSTKQPAAVCVLQMDEQASALLTRLQDLQSSIPARHNAACGSVTLAELLRRGATPDLMDSAGNTALHMVVACMVSKKVCHSWLAAARCWQQLLCLLASNCRRPSHTTPSLTTHITCPSPLSPLYTSATRPPAARSTSRTPALSTSSGRSSLTRRMSSSFTTPLLKTPAHTQQEREQASSRSRSSRSSGSSSCTTTTAPGRRMQLPRSRRCCRLAGTRLCATTTGTACLTSFWRACLATRQVCLCVAEGRVLCCGVLLVCFVGEWVGWDDMVGAAAFVVACIVGYLPATCSTCQRHTHTLLPAPASQHNHHTKLLRQPRISTNHQS